MQRSSEAGRMLVAIKALHTAVWLFFVTCILAIPFAAARRRFLWAEAITAVMLVECAVIATNHGRCPLTDWAARYTEDRQANFDIYLPEWLARCNKTIFGMLFAADLLFLAWQFAT
jgi:hypothetical protein